MTDQSIRVGDLTDLVGELPAGSTDDRASEVIYDLIEASDRADILVKAVVSEFRSRQPEWDEPTLLARAEAYLQALSAGERRGILLAALAKFVRSTREAMLAAPGQTVIPNARGRSVAPMTREQARAYYEGA